MKSRETIEKILQSADVNINGNRPFDIKVLNERLYDRVLSKGSLGLGEAYMDGWWECDELDEMIFRVLRFSDRSALNKNLTVISSIIKSKILNLQTKTRSKKDF